MVKRAPDRVKVFVGISGAVVGPERGLLRMFNGAQLQAHKREWLSRSERGAVWCVLLLAFSLVAGFGPLASAQSTDPCSMCPGGSAAGCASELSELQNAFVPDRGVIAEYERFFRDCQLWESEEACNDGDVQACADLGLSLYASNSSRLAEAYGYLLEGCNDGGRLDACHAIGVAMEEGRGTERNATEARAVYDRVCTAGHAPGCESIARLNQEAADEAARVAEEARLAEEARQRNPFDRAGVSLPEFVLIPSGTFMMGSPLSESERDGDETQHSVTLTGSFYLQTTEVTQGQWQTLMGNNPSFFSMCGDSCPVERVSWFDAVAFANARSRAEGLSECYELRGCSGIPGSGTVTGDGAPRYGVGDYTCATVRFVGQSCAGYRLPTEAEWEYAARAGTTGPAYVSGTVHSSTPCAADAALARIAWFDATALVTYASDTVITTCDQQPRGPHGVGLLQANAWGLYDMLGNVWEWTNDWYGSEYGTGAVTDPVGPSEGFYRVFRGGSWYFVAANVRAANRLFNDPGLRSDNLGFRLARSAR